MLQILAYLLGFKGILILAISVIIFAFCAVFHHNENYHKMDDRKRRNTEKNKRQMRRCIPNKNFIIKIKSVY